VPHADVVEAAIRAKADPLARFFARILGCRVTVGLLQKHVGELRNGGNRSGIPPAPFSSSSTSRRLASASSTETALAGRGGGSEMLSGAANVYGLLPFCKETDR
jgi:hypothetical protein